MPRFNAQGSELQVEFPAGSGTFVKIPCLVDFNGPQLDVPEIDVTCMDDTGKEYLAGLADPGSLSATVNLDLQSTEIQRLFTDIDQRQVRKYRLQLSDNLSTLPGSPATPTTFEFDAFIRGFPVSGGVDAVVSASVDFRITGPITYTFGA